MSSSLLSYSSQGNTFCAGLFINTDQVFTIISFASLFFCEGRAYKSMYIYIYLVSINLKGLPMPSGDFNRSIERERERRNERVRGKTGLVPLRWQGLQARKDVTEKSKFIFFSFF